MKKLASVNYVADRCVKIRRLSDESRRRNLSARLAPQPIWLATWRVGEIEGRGRGNWKAWGSARGREGGGRKGVARKKSLIGRAGPAGTNFCFPSFPVSALRPPISHKFELIYMHLNLMHRHALSKQLSF